MTQIKNLHTASYLILALVISIFFGEMLIMFFINMFPSMSSLDEALLDAVLLLVLTFPAIYFLAFRPLRKHINEKEKTEIELFTINAKLRDHEKELEVKNFELKRANTALTESNKRFIHLFDFAPSGYLVLTDKGKIVEVNQTGAALLGLEKNSLLNRNFDEFLPFDEHNYWHTHIEKILQHNHKQSCKLIMQRHDKMVFYALLDSRRDDSLISSNIHISFIDITKQNWTSLR